MIRKSIILAVIWTPLCLAQNYHIDWWVVGSGGGHSQSGSYQLDGTIGQPIVGQSSSANYRLEAGFWVGGAAGPSGCEYIVGDINSNGVTNGIDVVYGVGYFKGGPAPPDSCDCPPLQFPFYGAGDVNGNCVFNGIDITYFVTYLKGGPALQYCADCPPAGLMNPPATVPLKAPTVKGKVRTGIKE